ncbi:MAG: 50S ribosomal protein L18 [Candidatus Nanoarchaeia archaeon]
MKNIFHRRKKGITDYSKRKKLLISGIPRIVFRRTNRYIIAQYVTTKEAKDSIEIGVTSKNLEKYGWDKEFEGSLKSIPAAYLTGLLIGKKIIKEKKKLPIFDIGMISSAAKTKPYAFLKGLVDSGLKISYGSKDLFPEEDRIKGKSLKKDFSKMYEKIKLNIEKE